MVNISKIGNAVIVKSDNKRAFPYNDGELSLPVNTIAYIVDESDYITFRSVANNDIVFTATLGELQVDNVNVTRDDVVDMLNNVFYASTSSGGGGGGSDITVDAVLSTSSTNPIQNRAVANKFNEVIASIPEIPAVPTVQTSEYGTELNYIYSDRNWFNGKKVMTGIDLQTSELNEETFTLNFGCIAWGMENADDAYNVKFTFPIASDTHCGLMTRDDYRKLDSLNVVKTWTGTQEEYDALIEYDADTTYYITE